MESVSKTMAIMVAIIRVVFRRAGWRSDEESIKGTAINNAVNPPGIMTLPNTDQGPLNMLTNWFKNKTHHSGLGTNVASVGSAGSPRGAGQYHDISPRKSVTHKKRTNHRLKIEGKKRTVIFEELSSEIGPHNPRCQIK